MRLIDANALCEYVNNQRDKTVDANDFMPTNDLPPARDSHHDLIMRIVRFLIWGLIILRVMTRVCSMCGTMRDEPTRFCPKCGARMVERK